jgi:hypothetical protein
MKPVTYCEFGYGHRQLFPPPLERLQLQRRRQLILLYFLFFLFLLTVFPLGLFFSNISFDKPTPSGFYFKSVKHEPKLSDVNELLENPEFSVAKVLIGNPRQADEELESVLMKIAIDPQRFPIVFGTETRMALTENNRRVIGIFFRVFDSQKQVELQWLTLQVIAFPLAA